MSIASEISALQADRTAIQNAINAKGGSASSSDGFDDFATLIANIPQGSTPTGTKQISVTQNGTQTENVSGYASAQLNVSVPNTYSAGDEGKVVSSGALVAQTSDTVTENDTYDTTLINSLTVNVSGGGYSLEDVLQVGASGISGNIVYTGSSIVPFAFINNTGITGFTASSLEYLMGTSNSGTPYRNTSAGGNTFNAVGTFSGCENLESISIPNLKTLAYCDRAFYNCKKLSSWGLPFKNLPTVGAGTFYNCSYLPPLVLASFDDPFYTDTFYECNNLTYIDCGSALSANRAINANSFRNARSLATLVFRSTTKMFTLSNVNAFTNTPFASAGTGGTLYVPNDMIANYQGASNWSTVLGYANNQIKSIESTHTDPNAPVDLTLYYADGTLIPT